MSAPIKIALGTTLLLLAPAMAGVWIHQADARLREQEAAVDDDAPAVAIAAAADENYCDGDLRRVLRRVLLSCGLVGGDARGCQPVEAREVATMAGADFNALFMPLGERASIVQFEQNDATLDNKDIEVLDATFADQRGASYFFVVARSSPEGSVEHNRTLSASRASSVMAHLRQRFDDPDLDREVGLLWLGEEFAQLDATFCGWNRSGGAEECKPEHLNRSAFVAWIDCQL